VGVVGEGDEEVLIGGDAEGKCLPCSGLVFASDDFGLSFEPWWVCFWSGGHAARMTEDWTRGISLFARATLVSATLLGRLTGRVASSMTMVSKPRALPSMAE